MVALLDHLLPFSPCPFKPQITKNKKYLFKIINDSKTQRSTNHECHKKKLHAFIIKTNKQINMKYVEYRIAAVRIEIISYCSRFGGIVEYHIPALRIEIVS